jgi:hypothetical protein
VAVNKFINFNLFCRVTINSVNFEIFNEIRKIFIDDQSVLIVKALKLLRAQYLLVARINASEECLQTFIFIISQDEWRCSNVYLLLFLSHSLLLQQITIPTKTNICAQMVM